MEIRELTRADRAALLFAFGRLSPRSRLQRYLAVKPRLDSRELALLLDVDHWHHEALVAWSAPPRAPIGVARYVRTKRFDTAELAIEVVDACQRQGVGARLLDELRERALRAGIRRFDATLLAENRGAYRLAAGLGTIERRAMEDGVLQLAITLPRRSPRA